ncbi:hypothetical protein [Pseudoalteromonas sp. SR43-5]|uniref:hypothetical protein n=1 Tax=Pseudoalteromonas sp. SR43-5 TaxID=2760941 RepID=UPI0015FD3E51|nr:hypothetical protein [Pseudoalteromonas sp. SR43-5]MBB1306204.1 hypothetical protein [Pseudoalteromonas sp. SR43-5]
MNINLDILIDSPTNEIDMKFGLETLIGTSDVITLTSEGILRKKVTKNITHATPVRTTLKQSFKGSYGQHFSVGIEDDFLQKRFRQIGKPVFIELIRYFIAESLYLDHPNLTPQADSVLNDMGDNANKLIARIRRPLIRMHQVPSKYNYDVKIDCKNRGADTFQICKLTNTTALNITEAERADFIAEITAYITRFNTRTGNGRLLIKGTDDTVSFGLSGALITNQVKKMLSSNLHVNNTIVIDDVEFLKLRVQPVKLKDGTIVKYFIVGILE